MSASMMAQIGIALRSLMNHSGFSSVKLIGSQGTFVDLRRLSSLIVVTQDMSTTGTMRGHIR